METEQSRQDPEPDRHGTIARLGNSQRQSHRSCAEVAGSTLEHVCADACSWLSRRCPVFGIHHVPRAGCKCPRSVIKLRAGPRFQTEGKKFPMAGTIHACFCASVLFLFWFSVLESEDSHIV